MILRVPLPDSICIRDPERWRNFLRESGFDLEQDFAIYRRSDGTYIFAQERVGSDTDPDGV